MSNYFNDLLEYLEINEHCIYNEATKEWENIVIPMELYYEVKEVIEYTIEEIEYSKKFINYKNGIEDNYYRDIENFKKSIEKFKDSFINYQDIKEPQRFSKTFATQSNYLSHLNLDKKVIDVLLNAIRKKHLNTDDKLRLSRMQNELISQFDKIAIGFDKINQEYQRLLKENPNLNYKEIIKILANNSNKK